MNSRTTFCAASSRVGSTSSACIEPETSITSTIVASSRSASRFTLGRAKPTSSARARAGRARCRRGGATTTCSRPRPRARRGSCSGRRTSSAAAEAGGRRGRAPAAAAGRAGGAALRSSTASSRADGLDLHLDAHVLRPRDPGTDVDDDALAGAACRRAHRAERGERRRPDGAERDRGREGEQALVGEAGVRDPLALADPSAARS